MNALSRKLIWSVLLCASQISSFGAAQEYDFSAVTTQLADNLSMYGGNVLVVIQQGDREIYR